MEQVAPRFGIGAAAGDGSSRGTISLTVATFRPHERSSHPTRQYHISHRSNTVMFPGSRPRTTTSVSGRALDVKRWCRAVSDTSPSPPPVPQNPLSTLPPSPLSRSLLACPRVSRVCQRKSSRLGSTAGNTAPDCLDYETVGGADCA